MQHIDELSLPASVTPTAPTGQARDGGHLVVDTLISEGVNTVFTVPGESFLPVLNALYDPPEPIHVISTRHEEGAGFAAEAWAKATGEVGVAMVTRGPGVTNISIALHTAMQDCTPLVVFVGQVPQEQKWREAFQEVDLPSYLGPIVKWAIEIPETGRIPELVRQAFKVARNGRPGPVVVGLPEDILFAASEGAVRIPARIDVTAPAPAAAAVAEAAALLNAAQRPVMITGRELISRAGYQAAAHLAEQFQLPAMTAFRRFDAFPNDNGHYVGPLTLGASAAALAPMADADVVLVLGERLDEITTGGYEFPNADAKLIHVASDASLVGTWGNDVLAVVADPVQFAQALLEAGGPTGQTAAARNDRVQQLRAGYLERTTPEAPFAATAGGVNISDTLATIAAQAPADVAITTDAGNFAAWVARYYRFSQPKTHFGPLSGSMGYSLPASIGVALANPARRVVALAGDGGFTMTLNELSTLKSEQLPVTVIVYVNGVHGTIMMHQQKHYPDRPVATKLTNPSFSAVAEAFGIPAWSVRSNDEFDAAFAACMAGSGPALIEVHEGVERLSVWSQPQPAK